MAAVEPGAPARTAISPRPRRVTKREPPPLPYLNRELSWLEFNARVLHEARDARNPLLERDEIAREAPPAPDKARHKPGEANADNNSASYPVIFSLG